MHQLEEAAIVQAEGALGLLKADEKRDAEELVSLCRRLFGNRAEAKADDRIRVGRLVELLARRQAAALPYAALGRALLAHLGGAQSDEDSLLREFAAKMALLGM